MNNNVFKNYIEKYSNILKFIVYYPNNNILKDFIRKNRAGFIKQ
jgi:hypothetical protein